MMRAVLFLSALTACEPVGEEGGDALVIDDVPCADGTLAATFEGLTVGVPLDRAFTVRFDGGPMDAAVGFSADSDPAFSLLRAPFRGDDALIVPLRVQLSRAGTVSGTLEIRPATIEIPPCRVALTASSS